MTTPAARHHGFVTVPPSLPERAEVRDEIFVQQIAAGCAWPNALLQHALAELEKLSIDIGALERRRDRLVPALRGVPRFAAARRQALG